MIRSLVLAALIGAATLLAPGCSLHRIEPRHSARQPTVAASAAVQPGKSVRGATTPRIADDDAALLARARERYVAAGRSISDWPEATELRTLLAAADRAAVSGDSAGVRARASDVLRRSNAALDVNGRLLAEIELQKSQTYTGLSDNQLARQRSAELALAAGQGHRAHTLLSTLNRELAAATQRYVVVAGDSLWVISGRPEVYGNPWLWPLIWQANLDTISQPQRLRAGQRLRIRSNPTIAEVVQALDDAHRGAAARVRIGEIHEAGP